MSMTARAHALEWAADKTVDEINIKIEMLVNAPEWQGVEFDDVRARHMRQTEIETLRAVVAINEAR